MASKKVTIPLLFLTAISGCNSGGSDNSPAGTTNNAFIGDTKNAVAYSIMEKDNITTAGSYIKNISTNRNFCDQLVKVVEESGSSDTSAPRYSTQKIFTPINDGNCMVEDMVNTNNYLVLNGFFSGLVDKDGNAIKDCSVIALPHNSEQATPMCIQSTGSTNVAIKPSFSGEHIVINHRKPVNDEFTWQGTSLWSESTPDDLTGIYGTTFIDGSNSFPIRPRVKDSWTKDGNSFAVMTMGGDALTGQKGGAFEKNGYTNAYNLYRVHDKVISAGGRYDSLYYSYDLANNATVGRFTPYSRVINYNVVEIAQIQNGAHAIISADIGEHLTSERKDVGIFFIDKDTLEFQLRQPLRYDGLVSTNVLVVTVGGHPYVVNFDFSDLDKPYLAYYDLITAEELGSDLFPDSALFQNSTSVNALKYMDGVKFLINYNNGTSKQVFFNVQTGTFSEEVIDPREVIKTIPLKTSND
ncbi:hypothetical protein MHO82_25635 [Vibrio sp. Of7-15]|uniref:hypothetical protein n=1 Tax=Vibrio sp. Of7-15 TaxID=2724879 RepID=UPI001EF38FFA|nr:hypothetical protein [Vibrio sp. Of7-15]MCG7500234.1 hypothetical protein [Vibrio sp. Of7-15]